MGIDIKFVEFKKIMVPEDRFMKEDTALFEGQPERLRSSLTYSGDSGPHVNEINIRQRLESPFLDLVIGKFGFFDKGVYYILDFGELCELKKEYEEINPDDLKLIGELEHICNTVDCENNILTFWWC